MVFEHLLEPMHVYSGPAQGFYKSSQFRNFATIDLPLFLEQRGITSRAKTLQRDDPETRTIWFKYEGVDFSIIYRLNGGVSCEVSTWAHHPDTKFYADLREFMFEREIDSEMG